MAMSLFEQARATNAPAMTALHAMMIKDATLRYKRNLRNTNPHWVGIFSRDNLQRIGAQTGK
jgi:hypothetical protein